MSSKYVVSKKEKLMFYGWVSDEEIRKGSSSGGVFYAISKYILQQNGLVYAAKYCEDNVVRHIRVDSIEGLRSVLKSKYIQ